mgnify:CR=1 FL=1
MSWAAIQAAYAAHGVSTYPLAESKTPAITNWQRVGAAASAQLAMKFAAATSAGFNAGLRNKVTVVDIDSTDEKLVDEIEARYGVTPLHVVTPSGGRHLYYRHDGETRRIRPLPDVDILGAGNVIAAGSAVPKGRYSIFRGTLDDLERLPRLAAIAAAPRATEPIPDGTRDNTLFRLLLREARHCDDFESLLDVARTLNMDCVPPLTDAQVVSKAKSAWRYESTGSNWVGRKARASTDREEILAFARDPGAALLLDLLRVSHVDPDATFAIDQEKTGELLGWTRRTIRERIETLIARKRLRRIYEGGRRKGDPHLYELIRGAS